MRAAFVATAVATAVSSAAIPADLCTDATCVPVFYPGLNGSKCYRIPSITKTSKGTLLAFAENRLNGCGDQGKHNLVVRRSSDEGKTWGPLITAFEGVVPCPGCPAAVSNPNPVEVTLPDGSTSVLLAFDTLNNPNRGSGHGLDMTISSDDDGLTWAGAKTLSFPPQKNVGSLIGPAVGLQADDGTLFFWMTDGYLVFSRDHGVSWTATQSTNVNSECSIAFADDASNRTIITNCRKQQNHHRSQFYWIPSGDTWVPSAITYTNITDPGCQGSIFNAHGALFTSNAAVTNARAGMTIHRSDNHGSSWSRGLLLHAGPSAYSQLVGLSTLQLGVLFEAGVHAPYETISFAAFEWQTPPAPPPSQHWVHGQDGTLSTDGKYCLDWTSTGNHAVYMSLCDPDHFPHHKWTMSADGHLTTSGAGNLALDWTSRVNADGSHDVYMSKKSGSLPHQIWHLDQSLTANGGDGLCLDTLAGDAKMRPCDGSLAATVSI